MQKFVILLLSCLAMFGHTILQADTLLSGAVAFPADIAADGVQHVRIESGGYFFKPDRVVVKVNVPVALSVSMEKGIIPHTLVIQAPEAGIAVDESLSSEAKTIRFTPTAVGSFPIYCKNKLLFFESHREKGMAGVLEVIP